MVITSSYRMIDISHKKVSYRRACVYGAIIVGEAVFFRIKEKRIEKGDPLILAEVAGINAVKNTSSLILLCHPIIIENVFLNVFLNSIDFSIEIYCSVFAHSKTGVEMEAMLGVVVALLTVYDLTKKFNPYSYIKSVNLLFKDGGESGVIGSLDVLPLEIQQHFFCKNFFLESVSVFLFTVSDRASFGRYIDLSGKVLHEFFISKKSIIFGSVISPDDKYILSNLIKNCVDVYSPSIVITTGGTGLSDRDITSDVINTLCTKIIPGIGEFLRINGSFHSNNSWLSRSIAGLYRKSLIISLPGKPDAVSECLMYLNDLLLHAVNVVNNYD